MANNLLSIGRLVNSPAYFRNLEGQGKSLLTNLVDLLMMQLTALSLLCGKDFLLSKSKLFVIKIIITDSKYLNGGQ